MPHTKVKHFKVKTTDFTLSKNGLISFNRKYSHFFLKLKNKDDSYSHLKIQGLLGYFLTVLKRVLVNQLLVKSLQCRVW